MLETLSKLALPHVILPAVEVNFEQASPPFFASEPTGEELVFHAFGLVENSEQTRLIRYLLEPIRLIVLPASRGPGNTSTHEPAPDPRQTIPCRRYHTDNSMFQCKTTTELAGYQLDVNVCLSLPLPHKLDRELISTGFQFVCNQLSPLHAFSDAPLYRVQQESIILTIGDGPVGLYEKKSRKNYSTKLPPCGLIRSSFKSTLKQVSNANAALKARLNTLRESQLLDAVRKPRPACVVLPSKTSSGKGTFGLPQVHYQLSGTAQRNHVAHVGSIAGQRDMQHTDPPDCTDAVMTRLLTHRSCPLHYMIITDTDCQDIPFLHYETDDWSISTTVWNWSPTGQSLAKVHHLPICKSLDAPTFQRVIKPSVPWSSLLLYKHFFPLGR